MNSTGAEVDARLSVAGACAHSCGSPWGVGLLGGFGRADSFLWYFSTMGNWLYNYQTILVGGIGFLGVVVTLEYAKKVSKYLNNTDIRCSVDFRNEKIGKKIRDAEVLKIPYMLVVGEKEVESDQVAIRKHGQGDQGLMKLTEFAEKTLKEAAIPE